MFVLLFLTLGESLYGVRVLAWESRCLMMCRRAVRLSCWLIFVVMLRRDVLMDLGFISLLLLLMMWFRVLLRLLVVLILLI